MNPLPPSPRYRMSRLAFYVSFALAWATIIAIVVGGLYGSQNAVGLAAIVVPSMVIMVATLLGIHRAFGSADMRSLVAQQTMQLPAVPDRQEGEL